MKSLLLISCLLWLFSFKEDGYMEKMDLSYKEFFLRGSIKLFFSEALEIKLQNAFFGQSAKTVSDK